MNSPTDFRWAALAARIVERCDRDHPADATLRAMLRAERGLPRAVASQVARGVFAYFRWLGWREGAASTEARVLHAVELARQFAESPEAFPPRELAGRAVPEWVRAACEVKPGWARALQREPVLWLRARPGHRDTLATQLGATRPGPLPDSLRYDWPEDLFRHPRFQAGEFEIQDLASQAVGHVCAPQPGETWWDACAGEGGKLLHLSALMDNRGLIWASDRARWRLEQLRRRAARARCFNYRAVLWDDSARPPTRTQFDGVLLDAPCAGLGTWGRNPHARWTTTPQDVTELAQLQTRLLNVCAGAVKPGGRLIYAVCTLTGEETEATGAAFTAAHPDFEPLAFANPFSPDTPPAARQLWWPQDTGGNGMYVAQWRRVGGGGRAEG
jgi:16S rRNA (cytosine967-C5)-methyltransferase